MMELMQSDVFAYWLGGGFVSRPPAAAGAPPGRIPIVMRGYDPILLAAPEAGVLRDLMRTRAATEKRLRT